MIHIPRIYLNQALQTGSIELSDAPFHHVVKVMRRQVHDEVVLFNGDGYNYNGLITEITKQKAMIKITSKDLNPTESALSIHLVQGIIAQDKMDLIIQKATELGVSEITPVICEFSQIKQKQSILDKRYEHWQLVMQQACAQSNRSTLVKIHPIQKVDEYIQSMGTSHTSFACHPYGDTQSIEQISASHQTPQSHEALITPMIGPEGGFSEDEITSLKAANIPLCHMGPRILRAETAAVSALSYLQLQCGDGQ